MLHFVSCIKYSPMMHRLLYHFILFACCRCRTCLAQQVKHLYAHAFSCTRFLF